MFITVCRGSQVAEGTKQKGQMQYTVKSGVLDGGEGYHMHWNQCINILFLHSFSVVEGQIFEPTFSNFTQRLAKFVKLDTRDSDLFSFSPFQNVKSAPNSSARHWAAGISPSSTALIDLNALKPTYHT